MDEIIKLDTIDQYNKLFGFETLHPLVSIVDFTKVKEMKNVRINFGFYALFLKDTKCGDMKYGRQYYDYSDGSIVCLAPGQVSSIDYDNEVVQPTARGVLFHSDLIRGTSLSKHIKEYTFFSYEVREALHLSERERHIVTDCLDKIQMELEHAIDNHSKRLITIQIELLLDYCMRFYERQFITRSDINKDIIVKFEKLLEEYFQKQTAQEKGLPSVKYFADKVFLSSNYFGDLIKKETGKSAQEYIQGKTMEFAKEQILTTDKTISQIAYELGFQYPQHFSRQFKRSTGSTPNEYRLMNS
ncbi:AraC family transcriptional regulator [Parabacteroides sp. PF5-9]|uniref:helix-turn-helix domain-containing protein n=1 Tax=Parabacteroides sp. PF5-9 TaxID=1742404 RepID=UPI002472F321|nr:AraC family transcriptional regulator [Parabacteroides sp. PF5-9]MDH6358900.1 AraC-like DNA-binding protein [Parabacteroides sp. PF5-9]